MVSWGINPVFTGLSPTHGQVTYALLTRAPLATRGAAARLACVRPVASVHPEPGSNSSLYFFIVCLMLAINKVIDGKAFVLHLLYPKYVLANLFVNFKLSKIVYFDY